MDMNKHVDDNQTIIEDLTVEVSETEAVKGGPIYMSYDDSAIKRDVTV